MALDGDIEIIFSSKHPYQRHAVILMATFTSKNMPYTRKYSMLI
jgi:hypothetical protein